MVLIIVILLAELAKTSHKLNAEYRFDPKKMEHYKA